jgi:NADH dehydrogenase FAD-containing subunit
MKGDRAGLLLVGGGHAHLGVLADWVERGTPDGRHILLSPGRYARYSGMIPGTLAGHYAEEEGRIDLAALAERTGITLIDDRCTGLGDDGRSVLTEKSGAIGFDWCSIDTGGVGQARRVLGEDHRLIDVRPIASFLARIEEPLARKADGTVRLAVVGGGAGGVEIAFALRQRLGANGEVTLVAGKDGLLAGLSSRACRLVRRELPAQGIALIEDDARFAGGRLVAGERSIEPLDIVVAALPAGAPDWPRQSGLAVDDRGFIAVDRHQRSLSHPAIFAVGDVAARQDRSVPHSGVHAVHTGPVLAHNLRVSMRGKGGLRSYTPRPASLYLISTGAGAGVATYGPFAAQGAWADRLKRWIDTRWIESFAKMAGSV